MRDYELMLVVDPDLTSEKQKNQLEKIQKIIASSKGEVQKTVEWGKRQFAYPIKKKNFGYYFLWEMNLPEKTLGEFDKKLKLEEGVIRYLLVRRPPLRGVNKHGAKVAQ